MPRAFRSACSTIRGSAAQIRSCSSAEDRRQDASRPGVGDQPAGGLLSEVAQRTGLAEGIPVSRGDPRPVRGLGRCGNSGRRRGAGRHRNRLGAAGDMDRLACPRSRRGPSSAPIPFEGLVWSVAVDEQRRFGRPMGTGGHGAGRAPRRGTGRSVGVGFARRGRVAVLAAVDGSWTLDGRHAIRRKVLRNHAGPFGEPFAACGRRRIGMRIGAALGIGSRPRVRR